MDAEVDHHGRSFEHEVMCVPSNFLLLRLINRQEPWQELQLIDSNSLSETLMTRAAGSQQTNKVCLILLLNPLFVVGEDMPNLSSWGGLFIDYDGISCSQAFWISSTLCTSRNATVPRGFAETDGSKWNVYVSAAKIRWCGETDINSTRPTNICPDATNSFAHSHVLICVSQLISTWAGA